MHTPIRSVESIIARLAEAVSKLLPQLSKDQIKIAKGKILHGAYSWCFISYRSRELTFCVSPALIAMAAVDLELQRDHELKAENP